MKQIIFILLVFTIGCQELPKQQEKINLETFLIGDMWCNDTSSDYLELGKICFKFTQSKEFANCCVTQSANGEKMTLKHLIVKTDYDTNTIYSEFGNLDGISFEGVLNTWKVLHKDTIEFSKQGFKKLKMWRVKL